MSPNAENISISRARVGVITRTKNRGLLLRRALLSVADQTFGDYIHVVVNDGGDSTEVTEALTVLTGEEMAKVRVLHHRESKGMEAASNAGIAECDTEFLVIHDDDDSWHPCFLERTLASIGTANGIITHSYVVEEKIVNGVVKLLSAKRDGPKQITLFKLAMENRFPNLCFLYRRCAFEKVGPYDEALPVMGDWDFNLRFMSLFDIEILPEPLANYHRRVASHGAYGNSIRATKGEIRRYISFLANAYMRRDLASGRPGLGLLVNVGIELKEIQERLALFDFANPFLIAGLAFLRKIFSPLSERTILAEIDSGRYGRRTSKDQSCGANVHGHNDQS